MEVIMHGSDGDWIFMLLVIGVIGWGAIEAVLWILRHLSWSWG